MRVDPAWPRNLLKVPLLKTCTWQLNFSMRSGGDIQTTASPFHTLSATVICICLCGRARIIKSIYFFLLGADSTILHIVGATKTCCSCALNQKTKEENRRDCYHRKKDDGNHLITAHLDFQNLNFPGSSF